jgi:hypothetical protein
VHLAELPVPLPLSSLGELELLNALQLHLFRRQIGEPDLRDARFIPRRRRLWCADREAKVRSDLHGSSQSLRPMEF